MTTDTPGERWAKTALALLIAERRYNPRRAAVVARVKSIIDSGTFIKSELLLDITRRKDMAAQDLSLFWKAGLLVRRRGAGRTWIYHWQEHPPAVMGILQSP